MIGVILGAWLLGRGSKRALALAAVIASACSPEPQRPDDPPPAAEVDAGHDLLPPDPAPWDGISTQDPDPGDWDVKPTFSRCTLDPNAQTCRDPSTFDLSACATETLESVRPSGLFNYQPGGLILPDGGGRHGGGGFGAFRLTEDGTGDYLGAVKSGDPDGRIVRDLGPDRFFVRAERDLPDGGYFATVFAGCEIDEGLLTACEVLCESGVLRHASTLRGQFVDRMPGEAEASGLELVAEVPVEPPDGDRPATPFDVYVAKDHAFVVSVGSGGGLSVFDVRNPAAPRLVHQTPSPPAAHWNGVWASGDALYVAGGKPGVFTFDISHPATPIAGPVLDDGMDVHTVFVDQDRLYAMGGNATRIHDISQPLQPKLLQRFSYPDAGNAYVHDAFVFGGRMYTFHMRLGMQISHVASVSEKKAPIPLGAYRYPFPPRQEPVYNASRSHSGAVGAWGDRLIAFEAGEAWAGHLRVLDVTDPTSVKRLAEWRRRPYVSIHNVVLDEAARRLYVAHYHDGVRVLDVSRPEDPVEVAYFNTFDPNSSQHQGFFSGAIGIRFPSPPLVSAENAGHLYVVDTARGLLVLR